MGLGARLFPGDRRVWQVAAVVLAVIGALVLWQLLQPRDVLIGANGVAPRGNGPEIASGQQMCVYRVRVPVGARQVRFWLDSRTEGKPRLDVEVRVWQTLQRRGTPQVIHGSRAAAPRDLLLTPVTIPLEQTVTGSGDSRVADICLRPSGGTVFAWGNPLPGNTDRHVRIDGRRVAGDQFRPTLQYLGAGDTTRSMLSRPQAIFERMSIFRPAFVGPWLYWILFLGVIPLTAYGSIRLVAVADRRSLRRIALSVYGIAVVSALTWSLITPSFETPDESEHFAAVQYFAETGKAVDASPDPTRPTPWSTQEAVAIDAERLLPTIERDQAKIPWPAGYGRAWEQVNKNHGRGLSRSDGGGFHPAISSNSPAYYALMAPAYLAARDHSPWAQLLAVRWENALLAALAALFAALAVAELMPRRRALAAAAGLFVAVEPMYSFMAGGVNNDAGVNAAAAGVIWLTIRALRRGLSWPLGLGLGALLALAPIFKGTGYELVPPTLIALAFIFIRRWPQRRTWIGAAMLAAGFVAVTLLWGELAAQFHRSVLTTPGGGSPTSVAGLTNIRRYVSWMWQVLVPEVRLPGMRDLTVVHWPFYNIYVKRGFGSFGWYAIEFPQWVYMTIVAVSGVLLAAGARFLWRTREVVRRYWAELIYLAVVPVAVVFAVEAAYANMGLVPYDGTPEQGRYGFPAIVAVAAIAACCCRAFGERRGPRVATALVAALLGLSFAGQIMTIQSFYV